MGQAVPRRVLHGHDTLSTRHSMRRLIPSLRELGPLRVATLAGWKGAQAARRRWDRHGGYARLARREQQWSRLWIEEWTDRGFAAWLRRPGGGRLWIAPDEAADWCRDSCTESDLDIARSTAAGTFDLIGSGPVDLGRPPAWRRDLYSGIEWPLTESARLPVVRGDGSDVRTVWELSRGYHFIALARAYWSTGDDAFRAAFVEHVDSWLEQNPLGYGPHWASPMDAAIRAANWALAATLFADAEGIASGFWARLLANLRVTATYVERYREWHPLYRGNHYVANQVGLTYIGALFADDRKGRHWLRRGARRLAKEVTRQVHADGVGFEASIAYHRLVTEMFAYAGEVIRRNAPRYWTPTYRHRLRGMYRFIATYLPPGGEAPIIGDADDGRLHAVSAEGFLHPRRHALGLPEAWWPDEEPRSCAFPEGGFYVIRHEDDHCIIRCGPVGLNGAGSHDHNDQLSFELVISGQRVIRDSGTYCYTRDLESRYRFRSTASHNVLQVGDQEQNPIAADRPWRVLEDRTRARVVRWEVGEDAVLFEGRHRGFRDGAAVTRRIEYSRGTGVWRIEDGVEGADAENVVAHFTLGLGPWTGGPFPARASGGQSGDDSEPADEGVVLRAPGVVIRWPPGTAVHPRTGAVCSERYGQLTACQGITVPLSTMGRLRTWIAPVVDDEGG